MGYCFAKQAPGDHHRLAVIIGQRVRLYNPQTTLITQFYNCDVGCVPVKF
ncbi:hypothetical protein PMI31_00238 [Pseudomonas sp. GM55]|nr:hypothetical protein PMI31_00238 [Pseudomonas sp. GM55]